MRASGIYSARRRRRPDDTPIPRRLRGSVPCGAATRPMPTGAWAVVNEVRPRLVNARVRDRWPCGRETCMASHLGQSIANHATLELVGGINGGYGPEQLGWV